MSADTPSDYSRASLFDPIARSYGRIAGPAWMTIFRPMVTDVTAAQRDSERVLDGGTGSGFWIERLVRDRPRKRAVGLDLSTAFLDMARSRCAGLDIDFVRGSITDIAMPDESFDGAVCAGVLDTLPHVEGALSEFRRVLVPGGLLSIVIRGADRRMSRLVEWVSRMHVRAEMALNGTVPKVNSVHKPMDEHWLRDPILPRIDELAAGAGLSVVRIKPSPFLAHVLLQRTPIAGPSTAC